MLADMAAEIDAAKLLTYRAAWLKDQAKSYKREAAQAKLYASEMCNRVAYNAVQIHGGMGFMSETEVNRLYRGGKVMEIGAGTNQVRQLIIAGELLKNG